MVRLKCGKTIQARPIHRTDALRSDLRRTGWACGNQTGCRGEGDTARVRPVVARPEAEPHLRAVLKNRHERLEMSYVKIRPLYLQKPLSPDNSISCRERVPLYRNTWKCVMKLLTCLFILTVSFLLGTACSSVKTGTWEFYHSDGTLSTGTFEYTSHENFTSAKNESIENADGKKVVWWVPGKAKFYESSYKGGQQDGLWQIWYPNGNVKCVGYNKNGRRVGRWMWFEENGERAEDQLIDEGIYIVTNYWPNGQKEELTIYVGNGPPLTYKWDINGVPIPPKVRD